ncbi:MAG: DUF3365 domain-containing protein [Algicola sp.]|nr:DUF3365 domain-containing protein [Algicola sp.]
MINLKMLLVLVLVLTGFSCKEKTESKITQQAEMLVEEQDHPGKALLETNCYVCHSPTATFENRIAPPMWAVKRHYLEDGMGKAAFVAALQNWMENPTPENVKMPGAVEKFGIMPKMPLSKEHMAQIADYLYTFDVKKQQGHGKHKKAKAAKPEIQGKSYEERGMAYAMLTKAQLGKNLMGTIKKEGTLQAVSFCNEVAYPITDSVAMAHKVQIKRVSNKARNPKNSANAYATGLIEQYTKDMEAQKTPKAVVIEQDSTVKFYAPITTNTMCIQCHGTPGQDIKPEVYSRIKQLYPNDLAVGYDVDQVRGLWEITMKK